MAGERIAARSAPRGRGRCERVGSAYDERGAGREDGSDEVGVVKRPLLGRISIRATFADDRAAEVREGDICSAVAEAGSMTGYLVGSVVGPLHAEMAATEGGARGRAAGKAPEKTLVPIDEIKRNLRRESSALVLVATPAVNDRMVELFAAWSPEVIPKDMAQEMERRLEAFRQKGSRPSRWCTSRHPV